MNKPPELTKKQLKKAADLYIASMLEQCEISIAFGTLISEQDIIVIEQHCHSLANRLAKGQPLNNLSTTKAIINAVINEKSIKQ